MKKWIILLLLAAAIWGFWWGNNNWLQTTEYTLASTELPAAFDGKRIVQVSDLHNAEFGKGQERLIQKVEAAEPDAIFLTGDLIDSDRYDLETSLILVRELVKMSDVYFVIGNHEVASNQIEEIVEALEALGVIVLMNEAADWELEGETVQIAGINDPLYEVELAEEDATREAFSEAGFSDDFTLLLAHRPEMIAIYAENNIDMVFSGHAHGGQLRLPGLGGLIAPGQGWFPTMTEGIFERGSTQLVLSRGIGNSGFPLRLFNRPEVVAVTLERG
ncbi:metallophosphoesterase [Planococcus chinensis]|uniref:Metallophosphoesterase n=1 Tax=Planococcus chinensis TaxID=272917 RepID=A0ABW4QDR5_9BACL